MALGEVGESTLAPAIRPFLADPEERPRIRAVAALAALRDESALPAIAERLDDPALTVRNAAALALERFGAPAVAPLAARLAGEAATAHPALALRTLGRLALGLETGEEPAARSAGEAARKALRAALAAPASGVPALAAAAEGLLGLEEPALAREVAARLSEERDPLLARCRERALAAARP